MVKAKKVNKNNKDKKNSLKTEVKISSESDEVTSEEKLSRTSAFNKLIDFLISDNQLIKFILWTIAEVGFVVIGILLAFQIDTWNTKRELKNKETIYLQNLCNDLVGQLNNIESQTTHEMKTRLQCEKASNLLLKQPYDIPKLLKLISNLTRQTLVVSNSVFEDLKTSGNLSVISSIKLRTNIIQFYQFVDYVLIAISVNNTNFIDPYYHYLLENSLVDYGFKSEITLSNGIDFSANVKPFPGSHKIILSQLENDIIRFSLFNHLTSRARLSSAHLFLLERLKNKNNNLALKLKKYLNTKSK